MVEKGKNRGARCPSVRPSISESSGIPKQKKSFSAGLARLRPAVHRASIYCPLFVHRDLRREDSPKTDVKLPARPGWHARRPMVRAADKRHVGLDFIRKFIP
jgi:hypothetical protein